MSIVVARRGNAPPACFVEELNTAKGVFVKRRTVAGVRQLHDGDLISLGSHTLRVHAT